MSGPTLGYSSAPLPRRIVRAYRHGRIKTPTYVVLVDLYDAATWSTMRVRVTLAALRSRTHYEGDEDSLRRVLDRLRTRGEITFPSTPGRHGHVYEITLLPNGSCPGSDDRETGMGSADPAPSPEPVSGENPMSGQRPGSDSAPRPGTELPQSGTERATAPTGRDGRVRGATSARVRGVSEDGSPVSGEREAEIARPASDPEPSPESPCPPSPDVRQKRAKPSGEGSPPPLSAKESLARIEKVLTPPASEDAFLTELEEFVAADDGAALRSTQGHGKLEDVTEAEVERLAKLARALTSEREQE